MEWIKRGVMFGLLLIILGATFARPERADPVIDASVGVLPSREQLGSGDVVVFVLDSPLEPAFVEGRVLDVAREDISHGSLVARVVRRYCRVSLVGLTAENLSGGADRKSYVRSLRSVTRFCRENPEIRVLVNVSLGREEPTERERELVEGLREAGAVVVAAAGNDNADERFYPAAYETALAVASARADGKALHSNYGEWVDIAASGDITFIDYEFLPYERLRREMAGRGSSFAAPRVTAALAWVLREHPGMRSMQAWDIVRGAAQPIRDRHFERGQLGAGFLDIYHLKSMVRPAYRWFHYGVPAVFFAAVAVASLLLIMRLKMGGLFVGLLIWLVALPLGFGLIMLLRHYVSIVRAGYQAEGVLPIAVSVGAFLVGAAVVRFGSGAQLRALAPGVGMALLLRVSGLAADVRGWIVGIVLLAGTALVEWSIRRRVNAVSTMADDTPAVQAAEALIAAHEVAWSPRVERAVREELEGLPRELVLERMEARRSEGHSVEPLTELFQDPPEPAEQNAESRGMD